MMMRLLKLLVLLLGGVAGRRRVLFISGVPRSGTSLMARFAQLHDEIVLRTNTGEGDALEYRPLGAHAYGGSKDCLARMAEYAQESAKSDLSRHDVRSYLMEEEEEDSLESNSAGKILAFKDPGNLLTIGEQQVSCEKNGVDCRFLLVYTSPFEWEAAGQKRNVSCDATDDCRANVLRYWVDIHERALGNLGNASVRSVGLDAAASTKTYEAIETWLDLESRVPVRVVGSSSGHQRERKLVLHGNDPGAQELIVEKDHLRHRCPAPDTTQPPARAAHRVLALLKAIDVTRPQTITDIVPHVDPPQGGQPKMAQEKHHHKQTKKHNRKKKHYRWGNNNKYSN